MLACFACIDDGKRRDGHMHICAKLGMEPSSGGRSRICVLAKNICAPAKETDLKDQRSNPPKGWEARRPRKQTGPCLGKVYCPLGFRTIASPTARRQCLISRWLNPPRRVQGLQLNLLNFRDKVCSWRTPEHATHDSGRRYDGRRDMAVIGEGRQKALCT